MNPTAAVLSRTERARIIAFLDVISAGVFGAGVDAMLHGEYGRMALAFVISAALFFSGIFWKRVEAWVGPDPANKIASFTARPVVWFCLLLIAFAYIIWPHFVEPFDHPNFAAPAPPKPAASPAPINPPKPTGPAKHYELVGETLAARSPTDADHEIPIVDALSNIFQKEADPMSRDAGDLLSDWPNAFRAQSSALYLQKLKSLRKDVARIDAKMTDTAQQVFVYCLNDLCEVLGQRQGDALGNALDRFISIISDLQSVVDMNKFANDAQLSHVIAPHLEAVERALHGYQEWSGATQNNLFKRRDQLSIASHR